MKKWFGKLLALAVAAAMVCPALPAFAAQEITAENVQVKEGTEVGTEFTDPAGELKGAATEEEGMLQISPATLLKLQLKLTNEGGAVTNTETSFITTQNGASGADISADTKKLQYIDQQATGDEGTITVQFRPRSADPAGIYNMRAAAVGGGTLSKFYKTMADQKQATITNPQASVEVGDDAEFTIGSYTPAWKAANSLVLVNDTTETALVEDTDYTIVADGTTENATLTLLGTSEKFAAAGTYNLKFKPTEVGGAYNPISFSVTLGEKTYSVTLDENSGEAVDDLSFKASEIPNDGITIPTPTRTGYTFNGWFKGAADTPFNGPITKDNYAELFGSVKTVTLTAHWTAIEYSITYNLNDGTNPDDAKTTYTVEDEAYTLPTPTKAGYKFEGWYDNAGLTGEAVTEIAAGSTGNKEFWAKWTANVNTITSSFASVNSGVSIPTTGAATSVDNADKNFGETVTFTVTPPSGYTVTTVTSSQAAITPGEGNYSFSMPDSEVVINVTVTPIPYTINFDANGGTLVTAGPLTGTVEALPSMNTVKNPTPTGNNEFAGWYTTAATVSGTPDVQILSTDFATTARLFEVFGNSNSITLYARWTTYDTFTVSYNAGGTGVENLPEDTQTYRKDTTESIAIPEKEPTRAGYTFAGWKVEGDDTVYKYGSSNAVYINIAGISGTLTFVAQWTAINYTITLDLNYNEADPKTSEISGTVAALPVLTNPSRTGYTFAGWYTEIAAGTHVESITADNVATYNNTTLYAHWTEIMVTKVTVSSATTEITATDGTAQFVAVIEPDGANNKELVWTVENNDGNVAISNTGLFSVVNAVENKTYTVRATNTASNVYGEATIKVDIYTEDDYVIRSVDTANNTVNVTKNTSESAWVVVALYKESTPGSGDVTLVKATVKDITTEVSDVAGRTKDVEMANAFTVDGGYTYAKVFMWNNLNDAVPRCDSKRDDYVAPPAE